MKNLLSFLLAALIGFSSLSLSAQSVTVANGTVTNGYIPVYGWYLDESQHNQVIYPESMLTNLVGETINMMMFYLASVPDEPWTSTITLRLGITPNTSFSSATHDNSPTSQIYSGNMTINNGVLAFVLDSTFTYTGGNLLLDITTTSGNYSAASFYGVSQTGGSMYEYTYGSDVLNFLPKTTFVYGNCMAPNALDVDNITQTTATLTWHPRGQETSWEVFIGDGTEDLSDVSWISVTDTSYDMENLDPNTVYTVYVRANCGTEYSYEVSTSFRTACGITPVPYVEGFESFAAYTQPSCWQFLNMYQDYYENYPAVEDYDAHSGNKALFLFSDYYSNPTSKQIAILPELDEDITNLQLSLYSKRGDEYAGTFYIGYITDTTDENSFVALVTHTASSIGDDNYHRDIVNFSDIPVDPDSVAYIALAYFCNSYSGWFVDDIEVTLIPDCSIPVGLSANGITTNSATVSWDPGTATMFNVYYKEYNDADYTEVPSVSGPNLLLENLIHSTQYQWYVVAVCDDGSLQTSESATFSTGCAAIDSLPYFIDFEVAAPNTNLPFCWIRGNEDTETPSIYDYDAYAGENALSFYNTNTVALPQLDDQEIDITETRLSFYAMSYYSGTALQVGVMTNPYLSSSFVAVGNPISLTEDYQLYEVSFANYSGIGRYIAFRNPDSWYTLYVDDVTLDLLSECSQPESLWIQTLDSSSATIAWSVFGNQNTWEVVLGPQGFSPETATAVLVNTPSYTFDNLAGNTTYDVYVRTGCDDGFSTWSSVMTFLTPNTTPATVPYICSFEDPDENALWAFVQNGQTNQWYIDSAVVTLDGSTYSMYISADSGATNSYNNNATSVSWAYRDIQFTDANEFELSFDWRGYGESNYDYLRVYIGNPVPLMAGDNTSPAGATLLGQLNQSSDWIHASYSLGSAYSNTTKRLFFVWKNDAIFGDDPASAIDNINVTAVACAQPVNLTVISMDTTSATISFTPNGSDGDTWELMYGTSDTTMPTVNLTTTTYTIENLLPSTSYDVYVRTLCASGDTSAWSPAVSFQTECIAINSIPRFWDFENNNFGGTASYPLPTCWDRGPISAYNPYIDDLSYYAYQGSHSLYFDNYYKNLAIMPAIDTDLIPINTLQVSFYAKGTDLSYYDAQIIVGLVSDIYNINTFVPVDTIELSEQYPLQPYVVMFNHYTGNANRIAFKNNSTDSWAYNAIYLDNLTLEELPNCLPVSNLTVSGSDMNSATLNWTAGSEETSWNMEYKEASDSVWNSVTVYTVPYTLGNLNTAAVYDIRVQADCGDDLSPWTYTQAHTQVCNTADQCNYTFLLSDVYGDGWNGGYISVKQNGIEVAQVTFSSGYMTTLQVSLCDNFPTELEWHSGIYDNECSFTIIDPFGTILYIANSVMSGTLYSFTSNCSVPTCPMPSDIMVSNIDMSSATVTWTPGGDEANWNVEYKEATATTWTVVPVTTPSYTINGLTAATMYDVRVQAECDPVNSNPSAYISTTFGTSTCAAADQCTYTFNLSDDYGDGWNGGMLEVQQNDVTVTFIELTDGFTATETVNLCNGESTSLLWHAGDYDDEIGFTLIGPDGTQLYTIVGMYSYTTFTFTTDCGSGPVNPDSCDVPTGLTASNITHDGFVISWNANADVNNWNIRYRPQNGQWTTANANTNQYTVSGLTAETTYEVEVQADCGDNNLSEWSEMLSVITQPNGIDNYLLNSITLYPNPANDVVNVQCTMYNVQLEGIEVIDVYGKVVRTVVGANNYSPLQTRINVSDLAAGMYFVRVTTKQGAVTKRFVKK